MLLPFFLNSAHLCLKCSSTPLFTQGIITLSQAPLFWVHAVTQG